ncbi:MAG: UDP-N-acetylmuramoyl-L-alanine--D-glutamate ligase, partial [Bifidobacteriaceae bacterium]|nr:UDP-N-acetylmuramoyl-L-alanine--D-glutamate ligase [Bifidobacteriaceae bacterium]
MSGRAAAAALAPLGAELALYDAAPAARGIFSAAGDAGVAASGGWGGWTPDQAKAVAAAANGVVLDPAAPAVPPADLDLLVVSPGWAPDAPLLAGARAAGVPIWSEVELAWRLRANPDAPWLAVTGTNGKTTAVGMLEAILLASGRRARAAGNVGAPLVTAVQDPEVEVFAVELSSFQLHHTHSMRAQAAAILNIAPDHLDWHGSLEAYAAAKGKIYAGARSAAVYNAADPLAKELAARAGAPPVGFTLGAPRLGEVGVIESRLADRAFHGRRRRHALDIASLEDVARPWGGRLPPHLAANALAATALALAYGAGADGIGQGLRSFTPGAHRGEAVGEAGGVRFADDSKATNAHAAAAALGGFAPASVVW